MGVGVIVLHTVREGLSEEETLAVEVNDGTEPARASRAGGMQVRRPRGRNELGPRESGRARSGISGQRLAFRLFLAQWGL